MVLNTQPTDDVSIPVSSSDTTEGTPDVSGLTFTIGNWNTVQTVTVTGVNDFIIDGPIGYSIVLAGATSLDGNYSGFNPSDVSLTNNDNDAAGFDISSISGPTTESGGTAIFTVDLASQPSAVVSISVSTSDTTEGTPNVAGLTFTTSNWNTAQTVTVTGVNDFTVDGNVVYSIILGAAVSTDGNYSGENPADISVTNNDNDVAGFTMSAISGNTNEGGGTATFTVVLKSQPDDDVSISVSSSDTTEGTPNVSGLTFTSGNWNTTQTVTVTGVDDVQIDHTVGYTILLGAATSTDSDYSGHNPDDVVVANEDNDVASFTVSAVSGDTTEIGGTATFTVKLTSQPTDNVSIPVTSGDTTEGTPNVAGLTFTTGNWNTAQTVTITGVDDVQTDGDITYSILLGVATSTDSDYDGLNPSDVSLDNIDNDAAGFVVSAISGNTTEGGGTATFTVALSTQPSFNVSIPVSSSDTTEGTPNVAGLTFTTANWNTAQTVTVTGVNDTDRDGSVGYTVVLATVTSSDSAYNGQDPADVSVTNVESGTSGVASILAASFAVGYEITIEVTADTDEYANQTAGAGNDTLSVTLSSAPTGDSLTVVLQESTVTAGSFDCTVDGCIVPTASGAASVDSILQVASGDTVTLTYNDAIRATGSSGTSTDNATVNAASCVSLVINEVVTLPQQDWNDSSGGGAAAFSGTAGTGTVGTDDEWIEIYNNGSCAVDLDGTASDGDGYLLHILAGSGYTYEFGVSDGQVLVFSGTSTVDNFQVGDYLIIGDPAGSTSLPDDVWIRLDEPLSAGGIIDDVALGTSRGADNSTSNNAPAGTSSGTSDEAVGRDSSSTDTNVDSSDFGATRKAATMGVAN
ncbi:MAG: hypothetical protein A2341_01765 [Deltaproteobacteria bacterium RIFOXYB12_FULL_58_9]|nr:MAG: hypothetical protein A2341_01765 [Deltaproteobacteria bacterium RIFOXYB12_FULL_58_9]